MPIKRSPLYLNAKISNENLSTDRRKALKICVRKLRHINDAEEKLHRAVLINNTLQKIREQIDIDLVKKDDDKSKLNNNETTKISPEVHETDIFSELTLPPPLHTNHLEQLSTDYNKYSYSENIKYDEENGKENVDRKYLSILTSYHLEEEINLFDSYFNCDNFLIQRTQ